MKDFRFLFERFILGKHNGYRDRQNYEREVQRVLKKMRGELFVDVGAHKLFYSNLLADRFNRVIAFEPNQNLNLKPKPNVSVLRNALSDETGQATFYCYNNGGADGLLKDFDYHVPHRDYAPSQKGPFGPVIDSFPVTVSTYDHIVKEVADLVKIDVEGAEFKVLNGMNKFRPKNLLVELHDERQENNLVLKLESMGYDRVWKVDANHWMASQH